ncbi:MAG: hypothetical protein IKK19_01785, partial [Bacteroidales bacterium]|nr:hypothetical protein [Bacteroidales bacterium]
VINGNVPPVENTFRLGNAWFVNNIVPAANANEEIAALAQVNPATDVVVSKEFLAGNRALAEFAAASGSGETSGQTNEDTGIADMSLNNFIVLKSYAPNRLVYEYSSSRPQIALFSEVYYHPGWEATITPAAGGEPQELEIFRGNWILRGAVLPEGDYTIEFTFNPPCFEKGEMYSRISSGILILLLLGGAGFGIWRRKGGKK